MKSIVRKIGIKFVVIKKEVFNKIKGPSVDIWYTFVFNCFLLFATIVGGEYYIQGKLLEVNLIKTEQQDLIKERSEFVKGFARLIQRRIYLAENYYQNVENKEDEEVLDRSWGDYMSSVSLWNEENLLNPVFIRYYFNNDLQIEFYNEVQPKLVKFHDSLLRIRSGERVDNIEQISEDAKHEAFIFSEKLMFGGNF